MTFSTDELNVRAKVFTTVPLGNRSGAENVHIKNRIWIQFSVSDPIREGFINKSDFNLPSYQNFNYLRCILDICGVGERYYVYRNQEKPTRYISYLIIKTIYLIPLAFNISLTNSWTNIVNGSEWTLRKMWVLHI